MKSAITLYPDNVEDAKNVKGNTDENYTVKSVYSGHLVMTDAFSWHPSNRGRTLIEKLLHWRRFYSGRLL